MPSVMLRANWPGNFRRCQRNGNEIVKTLNFQPGVAVEVSVEDLPLIAGDIGKALLPVNLKNGKPIIIQLTDGERADLDALVNGEPLEDPPPQTADTDNQQPTTDSRPEPTGETATSDSTPPEPQPDPSSPQDIPAVADLLQPVAQPAKRRK